MKKASGIADYDGYYEDEENVIWMTLQVLSSCLLMVKLFMLEQSMIAEKIRHITDLIQTNTDR